MILRRDGASRLDGVVAIPTSVPEIGRSLRRERMRQGMNVADVAVGTGIPAVQIDALEAGTVDRLPDRVVILKTLRRYADFLGLPAERYVVALVDNWPALAVPPAGAAIEGGPGAPGDMVASGSQGEEFGLDGLDGAGEGATSRISAVSPGASTRSEPVARRHRAGPGARGAVDPPLTGQPASPALPPGPRAPGVADTGIIPAVSARNRTGPTHVSTAPPASLRVMVVVVTIAIVVGLLGLAVHKVRPAWLVDLGITATGRSAVTAHRPVAATAPTAPPAPVFTVASTSGTSATFDVRAATFKVSVSTVGNPSWIQATQAQSPTPVFASVLAPDKTETFTVTRSLTVEIGSIAARAFVTVGTKLVGFYFPKVAPFTMTFRSTS